jgi:hypothetical protein
MLALLSSFGTSLLEAGLAQDLLNTGKNLIVDYF